MPKSASTPFFCISKSFGYFYQRKIIHNIGMWVQNRQRVVSFLTHCWSKPGFDSSLHWKRTFRCGWCRTTCQYDSYDGPNILYHRAFFFIHVLRRLVNLSKIDWHRLFEDRWYEMKLAFNWLRSKSPRKSDSKTFSSFDESALLMAFKSISSTFLNFFNAVVQIDHLWHWWLRQELENTLISNSRGLFPGDKHCSQALHNQQRILG